MNQYRFEACVTNCNRSKTMVRWSGVLLLLGVTGCGEVLDQLDESGGKGAVATGATNAPPPPSPPRPPTPEQLDKLAVEKGRENMRAIAVAMRQYQEKQGSLPAAATYDATGKPLLSWRVALLPHLGFGGLFQQFHHDEPWDSQHNLALAEKIPEVYESPLRKKSMKTNYLVPVGPLTLFGQKKGIALTDVDGQVGTSTLVVEVNNDRAVVWTRPDELRLAAEDPETCIGKAHLKGFYMIFADYRVEFLRSETDLETLESFLSLKEGQIKIPEPEKQYSESLIGESERAFEEGRGGDAVRLLKGAALVGLSGVDLTKAMQWSPALRRPTMAVRWGIAWRVSGTKGNREPAKAPAESVDDPAKAPNVPGAVQDKLRYFQDHTFELGPKLLNDLSDRCDRGFFGTALAKQAGKDEERPRISGVALSGISVLGEGEPPLIHEAALKTGCDFVLIAEVLYRPIAKSAAEPDGGGFSSKLTLKIIDVVSGEELWASKTIASGHVERIRKDPTAGPDPLEEMHDQFFEFIEQKLALGDLPQLDADQVKRRVISLISPVPEDPLDVLTEIKLYESLQLLTTDEVSKVYQRLLGESEGAQLATGTAEEREKAIQKWLP